MTQLSYSMNMGVAVAGQLADSGYHDVVTGYNKASGEVARFGHFVTYDSTVGVDGIKRPAAASDITDLRKAKLGVVVASQTVVTDSTVTDPQYPVKSAVPVLRRGRIWVRVEETVAPGDDVYVRYTTGIADSTKVTKGVFRKSPDGTAQVATLTPTAANATSYSVSILNGDGDVLATGSYVSDGSATATEICDGLRTALGTVTGIALSGTATLIVTASTAGVPFTVVSNGPGAIAVVASTASAASAAKLPTHAARWVVGGAADALAQLEVNF